MSTPVLTLVTVLCFVATVILVTVRARLVRRLEEANSKNNEQQIINTRLQAQLDAKTEATTAALNEVATLRQSLKEEQNLRAQADAELAMLQTRLDEQQKQFEQKLELQQKHFAERAQAAEEQAAKEMARMTAVSEELKNAFDSLAKKALESNNGSFLKLAEENLKNYQQQATAELEKREKAVGELVRPINEQLKALGEQTQKIEIDRGSSFGALNQRLDTLDGTQKNLQGETTRLVQALRASSVRGRWGELQLRNVVELTGMSKHCDFTEQLQVSEGETDKSWRPDMVIHLPGGRDIIVDAKATASAYFEAMNAGDEATRRARLLDHATQVEKRIRDLSSKSYYTQFPTSPEFVVMFLPGEAFFAAAVEQKPELIEFGAQRRVVLASPTTLIALLLAVAHGWKQSELAANAQKISDLGKQLYERICVMASHLQDLGGSLEKSMKSYNKAIGSMERNVLSAARKFPELGVTGRNELPNLEPLDESARGLQAADWTEGEEPPLLKESDNFNV